jgi:hypothetical protein
MEGKVSHRTLSDVRSEGVVCFGSKVAATMRDDQILSTALALDYALLDQFRLVVGEREKYLKNVPTPAAWFDSGGKMRNTLRHRCDVTAKNVADFAKFRK